MTSTSALLVLADSSGLGNFDKVLTWVATAFGGVGILTTLFAFVRGNRDREPFLPQRELVPNSRQDDAADHVLKRMYDLREEDFRYTFSKRRSSDTVAMISAISGSVTVLAGLGLAAFGAVTVGIPVALMGIVPGFISKLFFSRASEAEVEYGKIRDEVKQIILLQSLPPGKERNRLVEHLIQMSIGDTVKLSSDKA